MIGNRIKFLLARLKLPSRLQFPWLLSFAVVPIRDHMTCSKYRFHSGDTAAAVARELPSRLWNTSKIWLRMLVNQTYRYENLPLKYLVQYVVKRSGKEVIHHAEIVVCHIFDVGVAELSRTMALIDGFAFIVV